MLRCRELSWEEILSYSVGADCRESLDAGLRGVHVQAPGLWLPACVTLGKSSSLSESHSSVRQREEYLPCGVMGRKLPHDQPGTQHGGGTQQRAHQGSDKACRGKPVQLGLCLPWEAFTLRRTRISTLSRDFLGGPVAGNPPPNAGGVV